MIVIINAEEGDTVGAHTGFIMEWEVNKIDDLNPVPSLSSLLLPHMHGSFETTSSASVVAPQGILYP